LGGVRGVCLPLSLRVRRCLGCCRHHVSEHEPAGLAVCSLQVRVDRDQTLVAEARRALELRKDLVRPRGGVRGGRFVRARNALLLRPDAVRVRAPTGRVNQPLQRPKGASGGRDSADGGAGRVEEHVLHLLRHFVVDLPPSPQREVEHVSGHGGWWWGVVWFWVEMLGGEWRPSVFFVRDQFVRDQRASLVPNKRVARTTPIATSLPSNLFDTCHS
jgi:hypothetical protein